MSPKKHQTAGLPFIRATLLLYSGHEALVAPYKADASTLVTGSFSPPLDFVTPTMDSLKSLLSPLSMGTGAIQDTLVSPYG